MLHLTRTFETCFALAGDYRIEEQCDHTNRSNTSCRSILHQRTLDKSVRAFPESLFKIEPRSNIEIFVAEDFTPSNFEASCQFVVKTLRDKLQDTFKSATMSIRVSNRKTYRVYLFF